MCWVVEAIMELPLLEASGRFLGNIITENFRTGIVYFTLV
jgi:hypothetical protein